MDNPDYKYNELELLEEIKQYIDKTYSQHYAQGKIQTTEFIIDNGHGIGHTVSNVIKYAQRYGKKEGRNRKDILKIIHYAIIMLYVHDLETGTNQTYSNVTINLNGMHASPTLHINEDLYTSLEKININLGPDETKYYPV